MKNHIPWNKGLKGIHLSPKSEWKKGDNLGIKNHKYKVEAHNKCIVCTKLVWRKSERCKECFAKWKFQIKENHPRWKGGITTENKRFRSKNEWKIWRESVFKRDDYTCKECGKSKTYLEPHHIIPIRSDKNRVYDIKNGITLCRPCHQKTIWKELNFAKKYFALAAA